MSDFLIRFTFSFTKTWKWRWAFPANIPEINCSANLGQKPRTRTKPKTKSTSDQTSKVEYMNRPFSLLTTRVDFKREVDSVIPIVDYSPIWWVFSAGWYKSGNLFLGRTDQLFPCNFIIWRTDLCQFWFLTLADVIESLPKGSSHPVPMKFDSLHSDHILIYLQLLL